MSIAFITDFDGTITDEDFFQYVKDAFLDEAGLVPWQRYMQGELSHFDALKQIYGSLRVSEHELLDLIKEVSLDEWVIPTFELLDKAQIPIYIASAGCDYYINLLMNNEIARYKIQLITNPSTYTQANGLVMDKPPQDNPFYDENVGISKAKIVKHLQQSDRRVIFAGDGPPDIEPSRYADVVFAKKILLDKCIEEGISTKPFNSYKDIYLFFESELAK